MIVSDVKEVIEELDSIQELDNNFFHPFPARMPLAVAEFLLSRLTNPGDVVLDPMAGSGTTLVAARRLGRKGIGFDLNPLAVVLARAATTDFPAERLAAAGGKVWERAGELLPRASELRQLRGGIWCGEEERKFLDYWFPAECQEELFALAEAIEEEDEQAAREFLWAVFSSLIIAKTAGVSYAVDLAHSRPHRRGKEKIPRPLEIWPRHLGRALTRLALNAGAGGKVEVSAGDARRLPLPPCCVDFVLTSPPYLHAIDYIRAHKFTLVWMGYQLRDLRQLRGELIGAQRSLDATGALPAFLEEILHRELELPAERGRVRRYLADILAVLAEVRRVLKPGGLAVLAVGQHFVSRAEPDAVPVLSALAQEAGLHVLAFAERRLDDRRRALPPPRFVPEGNSLGKRMKSEILIALEKPR